MSIIESLALDTLVSLAQNRGHANQVPAIWELRRRGQVAPLRRLIGGAEEKTPTLTARELIGAHAWCQAYDALEDLLLSDDPYAGDYTKAVPNYADLMTVAEFREGVECVCFTQDDGIGYPVKDGMEDRSIVLPSELRQLPGDATHVAWYNK